jgi:hypothetical protein
VRAVVLALLAVAALGALATPARADVAQPSPKRKVVVIEYRSGSAALPGIARRVTEALRKLTSLEVLGPDQTRVEYGDHLDQVIVRCAGEAECIGRIGQKVGAAEVILVGISELGDVIVTMQRIDVPTRSVSARIADSIPNGNSPSDAQLATYLNRLLPPTDFVRYGVLDIIASEAGASVSVGGEARGTTPIKPLKLHAPASYDIRIAKDGFVPFTAQVAVPPDGEIKVRAALQRRGAAAAWYTHWYVLAIASVLVASAAGGTIYFVEHKDTTMPLPPDHIPVTGTLQ